MMASVHGFVLLSMTVLAARGEESERRAAPGPHEIPQLPGTPNVRCESTKGPFTIEMHPEWAPIGAARFIEAVSEGVYDDTIIYRVVKDQAIQFGWPRDPELNRKWRSLPPLKDDPQPFHNPNFHRGMIAYAGGGKNSRGIDVFITFMTGNANGTPRAPWESPFGIVDEEGMKAITSMYSGYGDFKRFGGNGPDLSAGYDSFKITHPKIDYLGKCKLIYTSKKIAQNTTASQSREHVFQKIDDSRWGINIRLQNLSVSIPFFPILILFAFGGCVRAALPKFTKRLVRRATNCLG